MLDFLTGFDLVSIIKAAGYIGIFAIIFAESGIFLGFFLPGDSLLFTAGFLASQNFLNIWLLMILVFLGAILGDNVGYAFGRRVGPTIFKKDDARIFKKERLERTKGFYDKHGPKTIILARFLPVVRTFAPILAGAGEMRYKTFLFYNFLGGALWSLGLTSAGYLLGATIPNIDKYLIPIILAIIILSILPTVFNFIRNKKYE